ncbi:unnamed protein product, partial [Scytosiphon promiscuus]
HSLPYLNDVFRSDYGTWGAANPLARIVSALFFVWCSCSLGLISLLTVRAKRVDADAHTMQLSVPDLLRALAIDERSNHSGGNVVQGESETIFRLSKAKLGNLGKGEYLRSFVALDLALGVLGITFNKKDLLREANIAREKSYDDVYVRLRNVMGARVAPKGASIAQIAVKFGGASAERSNGLLRKRACQSEMCRSTVTAEQGDRLAERYNAPEYHAAAFCVASVQDRFKVDRKALAAMAKVQAKNLDKICADIVAKCGPSGLEHAAKIFRVEAPGSADRGQGEGGGPGARGKGKRPLSPRQQNRGPSGGGGRIIDGRTSSNGESVDTVQPLRVQQRSHQPVHERDVDPGGRPQAPRPAVAVSSTGAADPAAPLNLFAKRLRRLESRSYEEWCRRTLGLQIL